MYPYSLSLGLPQAIIQKSKPSMYPTGTTSDATSTGILQGKPTWFPNGSYPATLCMQRTPQDNKKIKFIRSGPSQSSEWAQSSAVSISIKGTWLAAPEGASGKGVGRFEH
eukprot:10822416-Ditylum_brightwellii.AAC.1